MASEYWQVFSRVVPLAIFGGFTAVILNVVRIESAPTMFSRILTLCTICATGALSAIVGVLGISMFLTEATPEIDIVIAGVCGSLGQRTFDVYARKVFSLRTRSTDKKDGV